MTEEQRLFQERRKNLVHSDFKVLEDRIVGEPGEFREVKIPLSDGICLRGVVSLPQGCDSAPVIVQRTPYPNGDMVYRAVAEEMTKRGFGYLYIYCRGTGGSEGVWEPNVHERNDGRECLEWVADQSWSESIGVWGNSYAALTGWAMADVVPEKVKTMYLTHYGVDRHTSAYSRGLFRQDVLTSWAMENAGFPVTADYLESASYRPQVEVDEVLWGGRLPWYRDAITSPSKNDVYWQEGFWYELKENVKKIQIPLFIGAAWFDHHFGSAMKTLSLLSEECFSRSWVRIGAWNHFMFPCVEHMSDKNLELNDNKNAFLWFEKILKKKEVPERKISCYQIGGDTWKEYGEYPFHDVKEKIYYFSTSKADIPNAYCLKEVSEDKRSLSYQYDPNNPVYTQGAEACLRTKAAIGSIKQPECGWREDVLSFVTEPLSEPLEILGKIHVKLSVASDAEDTAFTARIMEIYPDGEAYNIRSGIVTLAYREYDEQDPMTYQPGEIVEADLELWDISWKLNPGSRLRIDISSSDFPQYAVHTNLPGIWAEQRECKTARQTIFCGGETSSRVLLPLGEK